MASPCLTEKCAGWSGHGASPARVRYWMELDPGTPLETGRRRMNLLPRIRV